METGKGKQVFGKRDGIKKRESDRELHRAKMKFTKGR